MWEKWVLFLIITYFMLLIKDYAGESLISFYLIFFFFKLYLVYFQDAMPFPTISGSQPEMQPLFSIEQAELIRRLRNSGITKEQVVQAFESFERIDEDLGMLYTIPKSLAQVCTSPSLYTCQTTTASSSTVERALHSEHGRKRRHSNSTEVSDSVTSEEGNDVIAANCVSRRNSIAGVDGDVNNDAEDFEYIRQNKRLRDEMLNDATKSGTTLFNTFRGNHSKLPEKLQQQMYIWYLKQQGMSSDFFHLQSTESRKDQDEPIDMCSVQLSESQNCRTESQFSYGPASSRLHQLGSASQVTHSMLSPGVSTDTTEHPRDVADEQKQAFMRENPMLIKPDDYIMEMQYAPRRERFTFREKHLEILEAYFKINQYPINDEREMIANKCNTAMTISTGRELDEKERVTNQNVQNWFNNRRKEIKKLARAEGINCSEVSLPSRLKPRLDFAEHFNAIGHPWSFEDKFEKETNFSSCGVTNTQNIKSEPCLSPNDLNKPQNRTVTSPVSSNQKSANRQSDSVNFSQSEAGSVSQSQTNPPTVNHSPQTSAMLRETEHKIKQEIFENK
ncbi:homeobox-containing protein 1-like isoform X2 [Gigantopelta aegis]|uniref:homeobox-containing protein 1-like isoform X2 n=1 Tax=Gigantopelta aegis TaxID=1735272 RepID=UPI001B88801A|nr:homeobox-containing protein 1-like isoform X2 [Gigantopelta aegis]